MAKASLSPLMAAVLTQARSSAFWMDVMPEDFRGELLELKATYAAGKLPAKRYAVARVVVAHGTERGIQMPSEKTVAEWLRSAD